MADISNVADVYQGLTPTIDVGNLTALQLALANYIATAVDNPFGVNQLFIEEMKTFTDSGWLNPLDFDPRTGVAKTPDLDYTITPGISYIAIGDDIYLLRRALDCGPYENRTELVYLGTRLDVAEGTFAYYGVMIRPGTVSDGGGGSDGGGSSWNPTINYDPPSFWAGSNNPPAGGDVPSNATVDTGTNTNTSGTGTAVA